MVGKINGAAAKAEKSETCSANDDIIELQDVRMSPIPSLRKGNYNNTLESTGSETLDLAKFPPSFRIARNYGTNRNNLRYRGNRGKSDFYWILLTLFVTNKVHFCVKERCF